MRVKGIERFKAALVGLKVSKSVSDAITIIGGSGEVYHDYRDVKGYERTKITSICMDVDTCGQNGDFYFGEDYEYSESKTWRENSFRFVPVAQQNIQYELR